MSKKLKAYIQQTDEAKDLQIPRYMSDEAAGMDLYAAVDEPTVLEPGIVKLIPTGIKIAIPKGYEAQIRPRSGLALKHGISLVNTPGTVDSDYRGEIKLIMINFGQDDFVINRGERIAQMVINKIEQIDFELTEELPESVRGAGGFGHTGV